MNLTELQKVDPETWANIMYWRDHNSVYGPALWEYVVQGELQRAIEKRNWDWGIDYGNRKHSAIIGMIPKGKTSMGDYRILAECGGDSPAEALLATYLEAIHED